MSDAPNTGTDPPAEKPMRLRDALRQARIEAADRTGVVVDLRDAEVARLEILNEALDPLFAQIPGRGRPVRSRHQPGRNAAAVDRRRRACADGPRQAHLPLRAGHPFRPHRARGIPRGRRVIVDAVTDYVARRMIEREHALVATPIAGAEPVEESRAAAASGPSRSASSSARWRCSASRCSRRCGVCEHS